MPNLVSKELDVSRLLFDLKLCGTLVNRFMGWLEPDAIAACVTDGLIEQFGCAFARIWIVEPERDALRLVASSGLYTRLDGSFSRVPMGAFKVGKIAQNCIPFLSNYLPEEEWVKDRDWAIANQIQGFAGLPLMASDHAIGVIAIFSNTPMAPEFLEVLQILSLSVANALASALNHQAVMQTSAQQSSAASTENLSERLAGLLGGHKLSLLGTEQVLSPVVTDLVLRLAKQLAVLSCHYCRLVYEEDRITLEAMLEAEALADLDKSDPNSVFEEISVAALALGGSFQAQPSIRQKVMQVRLQLPQQVLEQPTESKVVMAAKDSPLSERETEVIELLAQGFRDREIAEKLYISERTVKFHVKNMLAKLGVRTRIQAVYEATRQGWLG